MQAVIGIFKCADELAHFLVPGTLARRLLAREGVSFDQPIMEPGIGRFSKRQAVTMKQHASLPDFS